ncbi:MAG: hypothetical protein ACP59X_16200 [Solidesulfovibrio sp. DCME]|uniref:hypothetical protein n=1 Tax=Solidesulfovibrio sp. DCME TaxID=3447380 RepID=UPI003D0B3FF1
MSRMLPLAFLLAWLALPGLVLAGDTEFGRLDRNKDGKVSKQEFMRWYPVTVWKRVDGAGKGYVTETEWVPVRESVAKYKREKARDARVTN